MALLLSLGWAMAARADTLDPQLFVCQSCSTPAGGDPNIITNPALLDIGVAGAGHQTQNPVILIVGVYDGNGATLAPTVSIGGVLQPLGGLGDWGETTDHVQMLAGTDAYVDVGFPDLNGGNSETFSNWSGGDVKDGFAAPTSFELFAFVLNEGLIGNTANPLTISGAAAGSFVIGYSCEVGGPTAASGQPCMDGNVDSTPFTNAGIIAPRISPIPEPGTLMLFGSGAVLVGLSRFTRRKLR
jgi:hypothetical protein